MVGRKDGLRRKREGDMARMEKDKKAEKERGKDAGRKGGREGRRGIEGRMWEKRNDGRREEQKECGSASRENLKGQIQKPQ